MGSQMGTRAVADIRNQWDDEKGALENQLAGWRVWWTLTYNNPRGYLEWSAMPENADVAACRAYDPGELIKKASEFESDIEKHIAEQRRKLDETPDGYTHERSAIQSNLAAMERLAETRRRHRSDRKFP
jgi:hypothetical protein